VNRVNPNQNISTHYQSILVLQRKNLLVKRLETIHPQPPLAFTLGSVEWYSRLPPLAAACSICITLTNYSFVRFGSSALQFDLTSTFRIILQTEVPDGQPCAHAGRRNTRCIPQGVMTMKIFMSHSSKHTPRVRELIHDERRLPVGDNITESIKDAGTDFLIRFVDLSRTTSACVSKELEWALHGESKLGHNFVLPVVLDREAWDLIEPDLLPDFVLRYSCWWILTASHA
jgi:hypothetical protein